MISTRSVFNITQGLIEQLPPDHDGRNLWLMTYGTSEAAIEIRDSYLKKNGVGVHIEPIKISYSDENEVAQPTANDRQEGGDHYKNKKIQPWDYIIANEIPFLEGNIIKYITRHPVKNGLQDILKAKHYLDKLIEVHKERGDT